MGMGGQRWAGSGAGGTTGAGAMEPWVRAGAGAREAGGEGRVEHGPGEGRSWEEAGQDLMLSCLLAQPPRESHILKCRHFRMVHLGCLPRVCRCSEHTSCKLAGIGCVQAPYSTSLQPWVSCPDPQGHLFREPPSAVVTCVSLCAQLCLLSTELVVLALPFLQLSARCVDGPRAFWAPYLSGPRCHSRVPGHSLCSVFHTLLTALMQV